MGLTSESDIRCSRRTGKPLELRGILAFAKYAPGEAVMVGMEKRRVLIVDDESMIADTLVTIFSLSGYEARAAYSAEHALALVELWEPELAIVDVYLPGMNGIDLAMLLELHFPGIKISLFSGQPGAQELLAAAGRNFEIMAKPVPPGDMLEAASRLLPPEKDEDLKNLPN
jgi:DNA-binding NtrC family response regulator